MSKSSTSTNTCQLFQAIAERTWHKIARSHRHNVHVPEIGITADILTDIVEHSDSQGPKIDVYAKKGYLENVYGSDLDLFVKTATGRYHWYALQAKVLVKQKRNSVYTTLRDGNKADVPLNYQWDKLIFLSQKGCTPYYLLYNGMENQGTNLEKSLRGLHKFNIGDTICTPPYLSEMYGCSLVTPKTIKKYALEKNERGFISPKFSDFHPEYAIPWHHLVCCAPPTNNTATFTLQQIMATNGNRVHLNQPSDAEDDAGSENQLDQVASPKAAYQNPMATAMAEAGWYPGVRLVVHTSPHKIDSL